MMRSDSLLTIKNLIFLGEVILSAAIAYYSTRLALIGFSKDRASFKRLTARIYESWYFPPLQIAVLIGGVTAGALLVVDLKAESDLFALESEFGLEKCAEDGVRDHLRKLDPFYQLLSRLHSPDQKDILPVPLLATRVDIDTLVDLRKAAIRQCITSSDTDGTRSARLNQATSWHRYLDHIGRANIPLLFPIFVTTFVFLLRYSDHIWPNDSENWRDAAITQGIGATVAAFALQFLLSIIKTLLV